MGNDLIRYLYSIFFPERCRGCGTVGSAICIRCIRNIPLASKLPPGTYGVFAYTNRIVRWTIRDLKYHRRSESARILTAAAAPYINDYIADVLHTIHEERLVLVPIPEHRRKETSRGFNQSALLATWWKPTIPGSVISHLLEKTVATLPQARLNRNARLQNVAHTMRCTEVLDAKTMYVVIDDVTTTGATFIEARRALTAAGAKKILCIALAHGYAHAYIPL
ncbi:MAG: ComF family protein [Candidatus Pacebacteria bacterium]|nr:ComF family protein [Candidatus Paceibacterota bacterium]MBP9701047.1 ComF family protein [Candidatus Paceibacterota bacterium]